MVDEEIPPFYVKRFEYPEKRYINVTNIIITLTTNERVCFKAFATVELGLI